MMDKSEMSVTVALVSLALAVANTLVLRFEGSSLQAYIDPAGVKTICVGHTSLSDGVPVPDKMTQAECDALLKKDMERAMDAVVRCQGANHPPSVLGAFADATFNVGPKIVCDPKTATTSALAVGDYEGACQGLRKWDKIRTGDGALKPLLGLTKRREAERVACMAGVRAFDPARTFIMGDSLTVGAQKNLRNRLRGVVIDAEIGRQMEIFATKSVLKPLGDGKTTNLVVALGTNGAVDEGQLDETLGLYSDLARIVLVNNAGDKPWVEKNNAAFKRLADKYGNVKVGDWKTIVDNKPALIGVDGIHPTKRGSVEFSRLIIAELSKP